MELIDTHCHLQFDKLAQDVNRVITNAKTAGVKRLICVGTSVADSQTAIDYAAQYDNVWASVGAHPHDGKDFDFSGDPPEIERLLAADKVVAVGEIGLDFYKNYSPKTEQEKLLRAQIESGLLSGLPFIFHVRDAWTDFWSIFDEYRNLKGVIHSFSSGRKQLDAALNRGLYVGLNGIMTFTKDQAQLEAAKQVPADRLLLETDAPFLTPAPERGQTCEPKHVRTVAEFLAELRGETLEELAATTTANAVKLFGLETKHD